ncbi:antitoxin [Saccharopolyspora sp. MS10]|uniref:antitoxin n=1 Tax=Saccharopolyspora sp. MS10 TaxID=3385973 RepID=UPI0039A186AF
MGLGSLKDKLMNMGKQHSDKVEQGIDKGSDAAKKKFGHEQQVDQAAEKGKDYFRNEGSGPQQ